MIPRLLLAAALSLAAAGCISIGGDAPAPTGYVLQDAGAGASARAAPAGDTLLLLPQSGAAAGGSLRIAYARQRDQRANYETVRWTEPPNQRLLTLLQQRLEARGAFDAVAPLGQIAGRWQLTLSIQEIVHDVSSTPTVARLALRAELIDRDNRRQLARSTFTAAVPAARNDPAAGIEALNRAVGQIFDQLTPWVEDQVRRAAAGK